MRFKEFLVELDGRFKRERTNQDFDEYTTWLHQHHNLKVLGSGGSARVFLHPKNKNVAVKVFLTKDKGYSKYLKWCLENQSNPWVPKIHAVRYFSPDDSVSSSKYSGEPYGVVFMERLDVVPPIYYGKFLQDISIEWNDFYQHQNDYLTDVIKKLKKDRNVLERRSLITLLTFLNSNFRLFDFHRGNFMMRGHQVVFVDPVGPNP